MSAARLITLIGVAMFALPAGPANAATLQTDQDDVRRADREVIPLTPEQEARARALEGRLKCPVCRSQAIRQSRSFMAEDMKRVVREMVAAGSTEAEVEAYFVERYGPWILLTPPRSGFSLTAYILPFFVVIVGAIGLVFATRRWRRSSGPSTPEEEPMESRHMAQLEQELEDSR